jgi:pimeloyl-ACP methyl ester carboxylesterase
VVGGAYAAALLGVVLSLGAGTAPAEAAPRAVPAGQRLTWAHCPVARGVDPRQECAVVRVPLDGTTETGPRISLAVSRIRTARPDRRRGVLLLIPGGPGSSGLNRPSTTLPALPRAVLDRYDLVSFDPRGVGASSPASCRLAPDDVAPTHLFPWPAPQRGARHRRDPAGPG